MKRLPLIWRVFLSTSLVTTLLFVLIGYMVQSHTTRTTDLMLAEEMRASFRAYDSLWKSRTELLASVSRVISGMPDVRAAFGTRDGATIRDTAGELWARVSQSDAVFLVTDPEGRVLASLSNTVLGSLRSIDAVRTARRKFPQQSSGFTLLGDELHQVVITPVYVDSGSGRALITVLVAGFSVNDELALALRQLTGGSDVIFTANGKVIGSTIAHDRAARLVKAGSADESWSVMTTPLKDVSGTPVGELRMLRPASAIRRTADLRLDIAAIWAAAILFALFATFISANKLLAPIRLLDVAAREVALGNYAHRVPLDGDDEMGRLGRTFNGMAASIQHSREELIRQERINTLGRIASSVVHDLRNPLAAIYSGAEILVDSEGLPQAHISRLAANIYRASRQVLKQLDDLLDLTRGQQPSAEPCRLSEVIEDAWDTTAPAAQHAEIVFNITGDNSIEVNIARPRIERVFGNLFANAMQAMPNGGTITVHLGTEDGKAVVKVRDTGSGVPEQIRPTLFQPFTTSGKSNGLGLGLALSRQSVRDHGGDIALEAQNGPGASFRIELPLAPAMHSTAV